MIPLNFEYYSAHSIMEALDIYNRLKKQGKAPLFYNGGTEIITMRRIYALYTEANAIIDIKKIPECITVEVQDDQLVIGSSVSLAYLEEINEFPLLSKVCSRIADHTSREKITIGGNICGNIKYKEAVLPLLLTDCDIVIANDSGLEQVPIQKVFDKRIHLDPGSFIVQIIINKRFLKKLFISKKVTRIDRIGYPLITVSAIKMKNKLRFAFSGLCESPFRSSQVEDALNDQTKSIEERINSAIGRLPESIVDDAEGSAAYREFVLRNTLEESITVLERNEGHGTSNRIDD